MENFIPLITSSVLFIISYGIGMWAKSRKKTKTASWATIAILVSFAMMVYYAYQLSYE